MPETPPPVTAPPDSPDALFERAAAPAYRRLARDLERTSGPQGRLLQAIREHLFRPGLNVAELAGSMRLSSGTLTTEFGRLFGVPPQRYLEDRRLECACRLLLDTGLDLHWIADRLGYSSFRVFSNAFARRMGCRPRAYRRTAGKAAGPGTLPIPEERRKEEPAQTPVAQEGRAGAPPVHKEPTQEELAGEPAVAAAVEVEEGASAGSAVHLLRLAARWMGKLGPPIFAASLVGCLLEGRLELKHLLLMGLGLACMVVGDRIGPPSSSARRRVLDESLQR